MPIIRQYVNFKWPSNNVDDTLFSAFDDGNATSTSVRLIGSGYSIVIFGNGLQINGSGRLAGGTVTGFQFFQGATKTLEVSGISFDAALALDAYDNGVEFSYWDGNAAVDFSAAGVAADLNGDGIGTFLGGVGADIFVGSEGFDELVGFGGSDTIRGAGGNDELWGEEGNDWVYGDAGNDGVFGYLGNDKLFGGAGNDYLNGGPGKDTIDGGAGRDWVRVSIDNKNVILDLANKKATVKGGSDVLKSIESGETGDGKDQLFGDGKANGLIAGQGKDTVFGGGGNDTIWGGLGNDELTGGNGKDQFVFKEYGKAYSQDKITDFVSGQDKIYLGDDPFFGLALGKLQKGNFVLGKSAKDADDHVMYDKSSGKLYYDVDGEGGQASGLIATLANKPNLKASDIVIFESDTSWFDFWL